MRYCRKCLQPDTRPDIYFDSNQVCGACLYEESKQTIDWQAREKELHDIADWAKTEAEKNNVPYDCAIGVSGGKDSTFQAFYVKEKLGLYPLLVNCMPDEITKIGQHNIDNLASQGFDILHVRPDPVIQKALARKSFYKYCNIIKASESCLYASTFIIAAQWSIPLVVQGENPALTLGTSVGVNTDGDALGVFDNDTLRNNKIDMWIDEEINAKQLYWYKPPTKEEFEAKNIRSIFLQYYLKEWSQVGNADFAIARGIDGRQDDLHDIGRYRRYTALDSDLQIANQMLKYLKFGFGFATDETGYDIREGRLTREDAKWLIAEYDGKCGEKYIQQACDYMGITKEEFWRVADQFVNRKLFKKDKNSGKWIPLFTVGQDFCEESKG